MGMIKKAAEKITKKAAPSNKVKPTVKKGSGDPKKVQKAQQKSGLTFSSTDGVQPSKTKKDKDGKTVKVISTKNAHLN